MAEVMRTKHEQQQKQQEQKPTPQKRFIAQSTESASHVLWHPSEKERLKYVPLNFGAA